MFLWAALTHLFIFSVARTCQINLTFELIHDRINCLWWNGHLLEEYFFTKVKHSSCWNDENASSAAGLMTFSVRCCRWIRVISYGWNLLIIPCRFVDYLYILSVMKEHVTSSLFPVPSSHPLQFWSCDHPAPTFIFIQLLSFICPTSALQGHSS